MNKQFLLILSALLSLNTMAQVTEDSISMGTGQPSYPLDVYYNLTTGSKDTVRNTNWHLAFSVRYSTPPMDVVKAVTVRMNAARGMSAYQPLTPQSWSNFDTANWSTWTRLNDSDSSWDVGAFNKGFVVQQFNFGWGTYDGITRDIDGTQTYLIMLQSGPNRIFKKFRINKLFYDTMWVVSIANVNGTDSTGFTIKKREFNGKLFAYYNLLTNTVIDREPSRPWHLLWSRYFTRVNVFGVDTFYSVTGVLQHPAVEVARISGIENDSANYDLAQNQFSRNISTIGWDWKVSPMGPPSATPWTLVDSLSFFVRPLGLIDTAYKLVFTKFTGPNPQITVFNKELSVRSTPSVGLTDMANEISTLHVYPNPTQGQLHVAFESNAIQATLVLSDISGKTLRTETIHSAATHFKHKLDISELHQGFYFLTVQTVNGSSTIRFVVQ